MYQIEGSVLTRRLVTASVVAAVLCGLVACSEDGDDRGRHEAASRAPAASQSVETPPAPVTGVVIAAETTGWQVVRPASCEEWRPTDDDVVVVLDRLTDECLARATRAATTVFMTSYASTLFDEPWSQVTKPWRKVGGYSLRRLSSGTLMELSSRFADAVVCEECDQALVVVGPVPPVVRTIAESVTSAN